MDRAISDLILSNITKTYNSDDVETPVLKDVSFTAAPGKAVAIVGPSGSGKSTLLHIIGSLDKPTSGTVMFGETNITALSGKALAKFRSTQVGFIFQDHHLLPQLTALENILIPTIATGTANAKERALKLLEQVGVSHRADAFPAQMSGGERQRVAVARALINGAKLLLCDEPTGNLDRESGGKIVSALLALAEKQNVTVLMVTHDLEHAARFPRCLKLYDGRLGAKS